MITVPVVLNFDSTQPIGNLTVDEKKMPGPLNECVFAVGYLADGKQPELICVSATTDARYLEYLRHIGALKRIEVLQHD